MYLLQIFIRNGPNVAIKYATKEAAEEAYAKLCAGHIVELSQGNMLGMVNTADIAMCYIDSKDPA